MGLLNIESAIYGMQKIVYFYPKNEENSQLFDEFLDKKDVVLCFSFVCSQYSTVPLYKFYLHLAKFILIVPVLFVVNTINNPDYIWAWWVLLGWGVGISIHAIKIFGRNIF